MATSNDKTHMECPSESGASKVVKQPRKSILKKPSDHDHVLKEATFDEMNILATYHPSDKDYGHMKIDEPKTPYRTDGNDVDDLDPEDVSRRLANVNEFKIDRPRSNSGSGRSDDDDELLSPEEREKKRKFRLHRKEHYNMREQLQRAKELLAKEMAELED